MPDVCTIACLGSGVIGNRWAVSFSTKGYTVRLYVRNPDKAEQVRMEIAKVLEDLSSLGVISEPEIQESLDRICIMHDLEAVLKDVHFIQESLPENLETKHAMLKNVDLYAPADAIIASSTSGMSIGKIAAGSEHPERVIAGHPFNPAHLVPLVELCAIDPECSAIKEAIEIYKSIGKEPVVLKKDSMGFIGNRLSYALYREAIDLVVRGVATVEDVDKAVTYGPAFRWALLGPFATYNLGSPNGIGEMEKKYAKTLRTVLEDMASWLDVPAEYPEMVQDAVDDEIRNFPDFIGHTNDDVALFRDKGLVNLLKFHNKI